MISIYSIFSAVMFYNIAIILAYFLMRKTEFIAGYTTSTLMLLTLLATIRLFVPADIAKTFIIESNHIIPAIQKFASCEFSDFSITIGEVFAIIWVIGVLICICYDLVLFILAKHAESKFVYIDDKRILRQANAMGVKYPVRISPEISEPYSAGILKPTIYLPLWELSDEELEVVLMHEVQHISSRDSLKKLVFLIIEAVFWWNPVSHIFRKEFNQLLEIQCDVKLMEGKSVQERIKYADTLLSAMKRVVRSRRGVICSSQFANSNENMKQRFDLILRDKSSKSTRAKVLVNLSLILAFVLSFFIIVQPNYEPPLSSVDGLYVINDETSYVLYENEEYHLYCGDNWVSAVDEKELNDKPYDSLPIRK